MGNHMDDEPMAKVPTRAYRPTSDSGERIWGRKLKPKPDRFCRHCGDKLSKYNKGVTCFRHVLMG